MPDAFPHRFDRPGTPPGGDAVERFASALDALVLGNAGPRPERDRSLDLLMNLAGAVQRREGTWMTAGGSRSATPIGERTKQRIWEELMSQYAPPSTADTARVAHEGAIGQIGAVLNPWIPDGEEGPTRSRRPGARVLRFVPDLQPLSTLALVIATVVAVAAAFSGIAERGGPAVTPPASAEGLAALTGQVGASPAASPDATVDAAAIPTADASDEFQRPIPTGEGTCPVEPRPLDEIAAFLRDPGPVTPRAYLPATTPDRATAEEVARTGRTYLMCQNAEPINIDRTLQTPRYIYEQPDNAYFREAGGAKGIATREEREQLGRLILGDNIDRSRLYLLTEQAISQEEYAAAGIGIPGQPPSRPATPGAEVPEQIDVTFLPEQAIQLADGRIAIPFTSLIDPADAGRRLPGDIMPDGISFQLDIFAPDATQSGRWGLDEELWVCLGNDLCDELYALEEQSTDVPFPGSATPAATPDPVATHGPASPAAAMPTSRDLDATPAAVGDRSIGPSGEACTIAPRPVAEVAAFKTEPKPGAASDYTLTGALDPATASGAIIAANLNAQCPGQPLARDTSGLESPRYLALQSESVFGGKVDVAAYLGSLDRMRELSRQALSPDWTTYAVEWADDPPPGVFTGAGLTMDLAAWADPDHMVALADGRIGVPMTSTVPPGMFDTIRDRPFMIVPFRILALDTSLDPGKGGRWVLDEVVPLCAGACDAYWSAVATDPGLLYGLTSFPDLPGVPEASTFLTGIHCQHETTAAAAAQPDAQPPYAYIPTARISTEQAAALEPVLRRFGPCMALGDLTGIAAISTDRFTLELETARDPSSGGDPSLGPRAQALRSAWTQPLNSSTDDIRALWLPSDTDPANLQVFMDTARRMEDGRIGVLATIASQSATNLPGYDWGMTISPTVRIVLFLGLVDTGQGLLVDEAMVLCSGGACPAFGPDDPGAVPLGALPAVPMSGRASGPALTRSRRGA